VKKIKPIALSIGELCLAEGISELVSQCKIEKSLKFQKKLFGKVWGHPEDILGLG